MLNNVVHKGILVQLLKAIYIDTTIAPFLGFKGGTAVYLFYELDRFSVDLDFDLLNDDKKQAVFDAVQSIIKTYGDVKDARIKRYSLFFLLSYEADKLNIKIEINVRQFGSRYELKNYLGIPMLVMVREDIFAHKLVAMYERLGKANRDIYDVHFFLKKQWPINKSIVEARMDMTFLMFVKKLIEGLSTLSQRNILNGIGELINAKQKAWVRQNLIEDTVFLLQARWV